MKLRTKLALILLSTTMILLVGIYVALFHFGLLEYLVNRKLTNLIGSSLPVRVHIGSISGSYHTNLILSDITVAYDDGHYNYTMAKIPRISAEYSLANLWRGNIEFNKLQIDSADFTLEKSPENKWLIPSPLEESKQKAGIFDFAIKKLNLDRLNLCLRLSNDSLIFRDIFVRAEVENRAKTYSARIDSLSYISSDSRFDVRAARGNLTLMGTNLIFQDFSVLTDSSDVSASGQLALGPKLSWKALLDARQLNIAEASSFIGGKLEGVVRATGELEYGDERISGNVTIYGDFMGRSFDSLNTRFRYYGGRLYLDSLDGRILSSTFLQGSGYIDLKTNAEEYRLIGIIRNFNLESLVSKTYKTDLNGKIDITGKGLKEDNLTLDVTADLDDSFFDEYHATRAKGIMTITARGIAFHDQFVIEYRNNIFTVVGDLAYTGGINLSGVTKFDDLSAFNGQTFIKTMGGRAALNFNVTGLLKNPDVAGKLQSDSLWLYEVYTPKADIDFQLTHFLYDRDGTVRLKLYDGAAYKVPYDSLALNMDVDSQEVKISSGYALNKYAQADVKGVLKYAAYPQRLLLDSLHLNVMGLPLVNDSVINISIDSAGYDLVACRLRRETGSIAGKGRINYNESMNLNVAIERIDIVPLLKLFTKEFQVEGDLSGQARISGTFTSPLISFQGKIDSVTYNNLNLGDLYADLDYSEKNVKIDSVTLDSHTGYYSARGNFPIDLSFNTTGSRYTGVEQDIDLTAQDNRLDAVGLFLYEVESLKGNFKADFRLTGTPQKPKIDGHITLSNGTLKVTDLVYPLEKLNVSMGLANQTISIDSVSAICKQGKKITGTVTGGGQIVVNSFTQFTYNIKLKLRNFPAQYELGDVYGLVDADLKVTGMTPPTVSGDVTIISALYRENFARETDGWVILTSLQGGESWNLNLNVEAVSNLWIKNDDIDAELAARLNFVRDRGNYRYLGSLEILRGRGFLADRIFNIESGGSINYEDTESPNPTLDIYADTRIRGPVESQTQPGVTETANYELRVHITGTLDEPIISAAESPQGSPQFTTEEIIPLIFSNYYQGNAKGVKSTDRFGDRLTAGISSYLSTQFTQIGSRTLGVETFEIDPVYGNRFDPLGTRVTVGFYTTPNLYVYGSSSISGATGAQVGFEYRLKRFLLVEGQRDDANLYHLLLNFNWDY